MMADTIAGIIGIIGAFLTWLLPQVAPYVQLASWVLPVALFAPILLIRLVLAPYWLLIDEKRSSQDARDRLRSIDESRPNIVLHSIRSAQLYRDANVVDGKRPIFRVVQVWFRNNPFIPSEQSMAKSITALIEVRNKINAPMLVKAYGVWSVENPPDFVASAKYSSTVDIPPGNLPVKLNIALKYTSEASAYAISLEGFARDPDGRDPSYEISAGNYEVTVHLNGIGVDQTFRFDLNNPGKDSEINLQPLERVSAA